MRADSARDTTDRSPQPGRLHVQSGGQQVMRRGRLIAADNPSFGDMSTPMGGMLTIMTGDNDHAYSDSISKNINRANRAIDAKKGYRGGRAPLGYESAHRSACGPMPP
jgi:hypothetical protein